MKIPFVSEWLPFLDSGNEGGGGLLAQQQALNPFNFGSMFSRGGNSGGGGGSSLRNAGPVNSAAGPVDGGWLYKWERYDKTQTKKTMFFSTIGHTPYQDTLGHPWCFEGFGDALTMAMAQVTKSEFSMMLSNAAAGLDGSRPELLWDAEQQQFVVKGDKINKGANAPLPAVKDGERNISMPDIPENSVLMPTLLGLASKFMDPTSLGSKLRSSTDLLCQLSDAEAVANPWSDNVYFCFLEDLITATLVCGQSEQKANCEEIREEYTHTSEDFPTTQCVVSNDVLQKNTLPDQFHFHDTSIHTPVLLIDLLKSTKEKMLPRYIPEEIAIKEAMTYLLLFRVDILSASFSRKPYLCAADKISPPALLPGWDLPLVITLKEEGDPIFSEKGLVRDAIPLIFVSQSQRAPCSFVISVRGTASMMEWAQDFEYWQTPFPENPNVLTHVGYSRYVSSVLPVLEDHIKSATRKNNCKCSETHLMFTGHSLGAGMAQQLSLYFAERYGILKCGADISGVFFAPPRMFNDYGSERFRRLVNGRTILDVGDGLSYMPCYEGNAKHGWPRCGRGHMVTPGLGRDFYADNYGIVEIEVHFMNASGGTGIDAVMQTIFPGAQQGKPSLLSSVFTKLIETAFPPLAQIPSLGVLGATHVCSFACKFSQAACGSQFQWWCSHCPMLL